MTIKKYNITTALIFTGFITAAHILATENYSFFHNTVSQLASQTYQRKAIMQTGFILFGLMVAAGTIKKTIDKKAGIANILIGLYGLSILVSGIFCTAPFTDGREYDKAEALVHSISATTAGFAFSFAIFLNAFGQKKISSWLINIFFFLSVIGLSALFGASSAYKGLIQKSMYLVSLVWFSLYYGDSSNCLKQ